MTASDPSGLRSSNTPNVTYSRSPPPPPPRLSTCGEYATNIHQNLEPCPPIVDNREPLHTSNLPTATPTITQSNQLAPQYEPTENWNDLPDDMITCSSPATSRRTPRSSRAHRSSRASYISAYPSLLACETSTPSAVTPPQSDTPPKSSSDS